jgi:hypothetical protein
MVTKPPSMMHTENRIEIQGDLRRVFQLAAQVEKWPAGLLASCQFGVSSMHIVVC